jgi:hypothetical protein
MLRPTIWIPVAALIGVAGCSSGSDKQAMDDELKRDLSAAVRTPPTQVVISPLEAGIAPAPKAPQRVKAPAPRPAAKQVATRRAPDPVPAPAPASEVVVDAEPVAQPVEAPVDAPATPAMKRPTSRPAQTEERHGPYKTEAEIFRQFPMIRP